MGAHLRFTPLWAGVRQQMACACVHLERFSGHPSTKLNHSRNTHTHTGATVEQHCAQVPL